MPKKGLEWAANEIISSLFVSAFYESDNSHFAIAISVGDFDLLTSIPVYLRKELVQGYIRSRMNNRLKMSYFNISEK